jgi:PEP-CTERM motif
MKSNIAKCACGLCLLGALGTAQAQSTWNYYLSDAGGGNSLLTWSVSGDLAAAPGATWTSSGPLLAVPISAPGIFADSYINDGTPQSLPIPDGSYFFDTMGGLQGPLTGYYAYNAAGSGADGFGLLLSVFPTHSGDRLIYNQGLQSALIPLAYDDFNPGTYESQTSDFMAGLTVQLVVGPVPEPSTVALFALGGLGVLLLHRRRK